MADGLGMRHENVELRALAVADARGSGEVDAGVAHRARDLGECPRGVLDLYRQIERHARVRQQPILPSP